MTPTLFAHPSPPAVEARRLRLFVLGSDGHCRRDQTNATKNTKPLAGGKQAVRILTT